jgi:NAD(P)-dependent dehydrogenase (short-subunit alcohol dehydrogenase family)
MKDKIALITGSASGIGEAIARRFAAEGAKVIVHDRPGPAGEAVAASLRAGGAEAHFIPADLADPAACEALIEQAVRRFGTVQVLVNNASLSLRSTLETTDAELFDRAIAVNLRAPMLLIRAALPHFRQSGGGTVLNIGSINGYCGEAGMMAYSVSKGALMTLTRTLADAYGPEKIRVNQINPGWVVTPNEYQRKIDDGLTPDWPQKIPRAFAPFGRLMTAEEIAYWALNFCSDENAMVSGCVCDVEQYPFIGRNPVKQ